MPQSMNQSTNQTTHQADEATRRRRNRVVLLAIAGLFFGALALAGALRFSGWRPAGMKNHGELLDPPGDLRAMTPVLVDGGAAYRWNPAERTWRILVAAPVVCSQSCTQASTNLARDLDTVTRLFGRDSGRVHVLWLGRIPDGAVRSHGLRVIAQEPALRRALPRVDDAAGVPVYVIDPNGFAILRYAPGFDPAHLRQDMSRLLKLK